MKRSKSFSTISVIALALTVSAGAVLFAAPAAAAPSETELTKEILDQLDGSTDVVVIEPATISNLDLLNDKTFYSTTSIVVVDSGSLAGYAPDELSEFIFQEDGYGRATSLNLLVVTSSGDDKIYVSAGDDELELDIVQILGGTSTEGPITSTDAGWDILRNSDAIYNAQRSYSDTGDTGLIVGITLGSIFGVPLLVWGTVALILHLRKKWRRGAYARREAKQQKSAAKAKARHAKEQAKSARAEAKSNEEKLAKAEKERTAREAKALPTTPLLVQKVDALRKAVASLQESDPELAKSVQGTLNRFSELREAIRLMEVGKVKRELLYLEYGNTFEQLVTLVGPKYYQDIKENPSHWRSSENKLAAIKNSFDSTSEQLLESIIQLKEGSELDFQISIERIIGFKLYSAQDMLE